MSVLPTVANNTFWSALSTIGGLSFGLIANIILARVLGPTALGRYNYWLWLMGLLVLISSPGLPQAMTRFGAEYLGQQKRQTASALFLWLLLAELILGALVAGAVLLYSRIYPSADPVALTVIALAIVPFVLEGLFLAAAKGAQDFRIFSQANLIGAFGYAVAAIAAVSLGYGINTLLVIFIARRIVTLILIGRKLPTYYTLRGAWQSLPFSSSRRPVNPMAGGQPSGEEDREEREKRIPLLSPLHSLLPPSLRRRILLYCRDVSLILVIDSILYERSEVFFLNRFATDTDIAFYSQSFDLALKVMAIPAIFSGVLLPAFSALQGQEDRQRFNSLFLFSNRMVALIAMPIGLGGAAIAPAFVLFYGSDFLAMSPILAILFVGNIVGAIASVSSTTLHSVEKQGFIVRLGLVMALANIALALLLIPNYGAIGAALANSVSQLISGVVGITYTSRSLHLTFPLQSLTRVALAALSAAAVAWLISTLIGGLVLAVFAAMLVYPVLLRLFAALDASDHALMSQLSQHLPRSLTPAYQGLVQYLVRQ